MRSLFLKIFLWFWLAMILVGSVFVLSEVWDQSHYQVTHRRAVLSSLVRLYGEHAVERWEEDAAPGLHEYYDRLQNTADMQAVLFDAQGAELSGRPQPSGAAALAARVLQSAEFEVHYPPAGPLAAMRIRGSDGRTYVIVAQLLRGPLGDLLARPVTWVWRLGAVILLGGIVCWGLARYLTAPIRRLRAATRQLARGDLSVRVAVQPAPRRDELGELSRDFDFMAARLEGLLMGQRRLLRDISHELRSPLARLSVALELARQNAAPGAAAALDRIEREGERLNELVTQLLTLARLESGARGLEPMALALEDLVREIAADAEFEAGGVGRRVCVVRCDECSTRGIPGLLRSAIENVVRNAVRHTANDTAVEIALTASTDRVSGPRAVIEVRDYGPGVPEPDLREIFKPFYRVGDARERETGGTGLGLAITARAVDLHGGTVSARNALRGGLIVRIELPAAPGKLERAAAVAAGSAPETRDVATPPS